MRIIINQKEPHDEMYKAKFFEMAGRFAAEYNKWVPEEDKAHIEVPYSFLLTKTYMLFPENTADPRAGHHGNNFVKIARNYSRYGRGMEGTDPAKQDIITFQFTEADKKFYQEIFTDFSGLVKKTNDARADAAHRKTGVHQGIISPEAVASLRKAAGYVNTDLEWTGQKLGSWFADRGIGRDEDFPELRPSSSAGRPVGGPGLFRVLLTRDDTRKLFHNLSAGELPPISPETAALYADLFRQARELVERINEDVLIWQTRADDERQMEKMRSHDKPPISQGQMGVIANDALGLKKFLGAVDQEWLEDHGICRKGHAIEHGGASAGPLLQALATHVMRDDDMRAKFKLEVRARDVINTACNELADKTTAAEPAIYAVDDKDYWQKAAGVKKEGKVEDGYISVETVSTNSLAQPGKDGFPHFDIIKSGDLCDAFLNRLEALKIKQPASAADEERNASIDRAKKEVLQAIVSERAATVTSKPGPLEVKVEAVELPGAERERDPEALRQVITGVDELLDKHGTELPSRLRSQLKGIKSAAASLIPDPSRGGRKRGGE